MVGFNVRDCTRIPQNVPDPQIVPFSDIHVLAIWGVWIVVF